jgi:hypothetical protein
MVSNDTHWRRTLFIDSVLEHGLSTLDRRVIELCLCRLHQEGLHLGAVVQVQQCPHAPHDAEDDEALQMLVAHLHTTHPLACVLCLCGVGREFVSTTESRGERTEMFCLLFCVADRYKLPV